jgi:hypothetical protein
MTIPRTKGIFCKQKTIVAERIIFSKIESIKKLCVLRKTIM